MSGSASAPASIRTSSPSATRVEYVTRTSARRSWRGSATADGSRIDHEVSGAPDQLVVRVDLAVLAQVADQVPVEPGAILPAQLLEPESEREVHRPPDLLVEEDVATEAVDLVVETERNLAEEPRPRIHLE